MKGEQLNLRDSERTELTIESLREREPRRECGGGEGGGERKMEDTERKII